MYTLHVANKTYSSWSLRPWVLMRTLGLPFQERAHRFVPGGSAATFRSFSPSGKVPVLEDGPLVVWDSLAIVEHLAERHPGVWPADPAARAWARSASAEMHSSFAVLRDQCSFHLGLRIRRREVSPALQADLDRVDALWGEGLRRFGGPYLAGSSFSAVDAFFAPIPFRLETYGLSLGAASTAYARRALAWSAMVEWRTAASAEDARDPEHDEHVLRQGEVVADLRAPAR